METYFLKFTGRWNLDLQWAVQTVVEFVERMDTEGDN